MASILITGNTRLFAAEFFELAAAHFRIIVAGGGYSPTGK